jgi:hypothetical protein
MVCVHARFFVEDLDEIDTYIQARTSSDFDADDLISIREAQKELDPARNGIFGIPRIAADTVMLFPFHLLFNVLWSK